MSKEDHERRSTVRVQTVARGNEKTEEIQVTPEFEACVILLSFVKQMCRASNGVTAHDLV